MLPTPQRIVLVTGASRGIGAEVAQLSAGPDTHVLVNYRGHAERAEAVAAAIRAAGGHASTLAADVHDEADVTAMIDTVRARFGRLDTLILNASGVRSWAPTPATRCASTATPNVGSRRWRCH